MTKPFPRLRRFLAELKHRNVYQVAATYAVVGFVLIQVADLTFVRLGLPAWTVTLVIVLVATGFPLALVLAWAFERTPEGMRRTSKAESLEEAPAEAGVQAGYKILVGIGLLAAAVAGGWFLTGGGGSTVSNRSVAVLPFETLGDTSASTFTQGLHSDLLTRLQRVSDLTVIARPSVMRYEDTDKSMSQVAGEVGARWIVTATVQSAGDQVRVQPRLIDPRNRTERWSASYRRVLSADEIFEVSQEVTGEIAGALEAELTPEETDRIERRPTDDLDAYRLYVRGRRQLARRRFGGGEHVQEAVRHFRRAIERDSSFALAWAGLADAATAFHRIGAPDSAGALGLDAEAAARQALELGPDLAETHAALGRVHYGNQNAPAALRELSRALELRPSYWEAHQSLGWVYFVLGSPREALDHFQLAVELNPEHALGRHGLYDAYNNTGQHQEALQEARRQRRMGLERESAIGGEVRSLVQLGRLEEARKLAREQVERLGPGTTWGSWFRVYLVEILAAQGDTTGARSYLTELRRAGVPSLYLASAYRNLGEPDRVLEVLEAMERTEWNFVAMFQIRTLDDRYPSLRSDPRYEALLQRANRAWGLNPDGSLPDSVGVSFESDD